MLIVTACVATAGAAWTLARAPSERGRGERQPERPLLSRFEYAWLHVGQGPLVFVTAGQQVVVEPPVNPLPQNVQTTDRAGARYTLDRRDVREHPLAAMDLFGRRGWEAVAVVTKAQGYSVLMKRRF